MFGLEPQKLNAYLLLLTKFRQPQALENFSQSDSWSIALGERPEKVVKDFLNKGMLVQTDLRSHLAYKFNTTELKAMLKKRGLRVSGRKDDLMQRLIEADKEGMSKAVAGITVLHCSEQGREASEQYLADRKKDRDKAGERVLEYLKEHKFKEASYVVSSFEAAQVFQRGIGIDWKNHDPNRDIEILNTIFGIKPKILDKLNDSEMVVLRRAAGMMYLWGANEAREWLPTDFQTRLSVDSDAAARMFVFYASQRVKLNNYRQSGVVKHVEILAEQDPCDDCKKISKTRYKLDEVPELPNESCTSEKGCRCTLIPIDTMVR